jgi:hypothetical protein
VAEGTPVEITSESQIIVRPEVVVNVEAPVQADLDLGPVNVEVPLVVDMHMDTRRRDTILGVIALVLFIGLFV